MKYVKPLCDELVIYDDGSTDGSYEYMQKITPYVIRGGKNDFESEIFHKKLLLEKAKELGADFVFYLDADEVLTAKSKEDLQKLAQMCLDKNIDALQFHKINLWRSNTWQRTDSLFDIGWFTHFWRITPHTKYTNVKKGLHQNPYPSTIKNIERSKKTSVLHYGFANEKNIAYKYLTYKSHGQKGYNMLDRLISEEKLQLKKISKKLFPKGLYVKNEPKPQKKSLLESLVYIQEYKKKVRHPKYSIVCLIYKSTEWLEFVYTQVLKYTDMKDVEFFFVANDATPEVLSYLENNYIPHYVWENTEKQRMEWYINNVYRAWNFGAKKAKGEFVIFVNSDMAFSPNWLENLINAYDGKNCVTSRLVESGKMPSGKYGISKNFGRSITTYQEEKFQKYVTSVSMNVKNPGGLFMPLLIKKSNFSSVGGYPEGNIAPGSNVFKPRIAKEGEVCVSGDVVLMEKLMKQGINHNTVFNSIVYHFQEGEMDSKKPKRDHFPRHIAICNDLVTGTMEEKVLWDFLLTDLPGSYGIDKRVVGTNNFEKNAKKYITSNFPNTNIIIQNASFIGAVDQSIYTISFLQDNLRGMNNKSQQQEKNLKKSNKLVTNSIQTALNYPEYDFEIIPIGVNEKLFRPLDKISMRKKHNIPKGKIGIFVGSLSEVKGWRTIEKCIKENQKVTWIIVSKYQESFKAKNVIFFSQVSQKVLVELYNCADFFILGSPVETQALVAVEAALCNIPVIMRNTGVFTNFSTKDKESIGIFGNDFNKAIKSIFRLRFRPRSTILQNNITIHNTIKLWTELLVKSSQEITLKMIRNESTKDKNTLIHEMINTLGTYQSQISRTLIVQKIIGKVKNGKRKYLI